MYGPKEGYPFSVRVGVGMSATLSSLLSSTMRSSKVLKVGNLGVFFSIGSHL